jgi:hypothetical protein
MIKTFQFPDTPGWAFTVEEVSYGAYRIDGHDATGRLVSRHGSDFDSLLKECAADARLLSSQMKTEE